MDIEHPSFYQAHLSRIKLNQDNIFSNQSMTKKKEAKHIVCYFNALKIILLINLIKISINNNTNISIWGRYGAASIPRNSPGCPKFDPNKLGIVIFRA